MLNTVGKRVDNSIIFTSPHKLKHQLALIRKYIPPTEVKGQVCVRRYRNSKKFIKETHLEIRHVVHTIIEHIRYFVKHSIRMIKSSVLQAQH